MNRNILDKEKEYGLVLEGGGAKGAYQIGVWKALLEHQIKIKAVAGASVGALNGALICMQDVHKAISLWKNISYSKVMDIDDTIMEKVMELELKEVPTARVLSFLFKTIQDRGFDVTPLKKLIEDTIDEDKIRNGDIEFWLTTNNLSDRKVEKLSAKDIPEGQMKDYLLASAYFPAFRLEKLNGKYYLDGGTTNNVPIDLLIDQGYKDIIVIRIFGPGLEKRTKIPEDVTVYTIEPSIHLGNVLDFNTKKSYRNLKAGYFDGLRFIKGLIGSIYYIEDNMTENQCLNALLEQTEAVKEELCMEYKDIQIECFYRGLLEVILPSIASQLKLDKRWNYKDLYVAMLEVAAKSLRVKKYETYTITSLRQEIIRKYNKKGMGEEAKEELGQLEQLILMLILGLSKNPPLLTV